MEQVKKVRTGPVRAAARTKSIGINALAERRPLQTSAKGGCTPSQFPASESKVGRARPSAGRARPSAGRARPSAGWLNTHHYDGKIEIPHFMRAEIDRAHQVPKGTKMARFGQLRSQIQAAYPSAMGMLQLLINSYHLPGNFDPTNSLRAEDLLYLCCELVETNPESLMLLASQIEQIRSGTCAQGRTHRLYQVLKIHPGWREHDDSILKSSQEREKESPEREKESQISTSDSL